MYIPVHSLRLPDYINVMQTIFVILTMAGLILDRPCIFSLFRTSEMVIERAWEETSKDFTFFKSFHNFSVTVDIHYYISFRYIP